MKTHFLCKILEERIATMRLIPYGFQNVHSMHCKNRQRNILLADNTLLPSWVRYVTTGSLKATSSWDFFFNIIFVSEFSYSDVRFFEIILYISSLFFQQLQNICHTFHSLSIFLFYSTYFRQIVRVMESMLLKTKRLTINWYYWPYRIA